MVNHAICSICVYSDVLTSAELTAALPVPPTTTHDRGRTTRLGFTHPRSLWAIDVTDESPGTAADDALPAALDLFEPAASAVAALGESVETVVWLSMGSDSAQGGFVLSAASSHGWRRSARHSGGPSASSRRTTAVLVPAPDCTRTGARRPSGADLGDSAV